MADELELNLRVSYSSDGTDEHFPDAAHRAINVNVTGTALIHNRQTVGTSEEALSLGDVTTGGWLFLLNRDADNFVSLRSGTGATNVVRVNPGEWAAFRISSSASAPYVIADTAAVELEYLLLSA